MQKYSALILVCQAVFAVIWIYRGRRRRHPDDHPRCQKCGYDLFGQPTPLVICNECGATLANNGSVEIGFKPAKRSMIFSGIRTLIFPVVVVFGSAYFWQRSGGWIPYAPTGWVISSASSNEITMQMTALNELKKRIAAHELNDAQWEELAKAAIVYRSNPANDVDPFWEPMMEAGFAGNHLSGAMRQRYRDCMVRQFQGADPNSVRAVMVGADLQRLDSITQAAPARLN
jgi:hypothetical protein